MAKYNQHGSEIWCGGRKVAAIPHRNGLKDIADAVECAAVIVAELNRLIAERSVVTHAMLESAQRGINE